MRYRAVGSSTLAFLSDVVAKIAAKIDPSDIAYNFGFVINLAILMLLQNIPVIVRI